MKKTLLILTSILILSCVSLPNPQETNTGMVVFMHNLDNQANIEIFGHYRVTIEGIDSAYKLEKNVSRKTGLVKFFLEPGMYKVSNLHFVYNNVGSKSDLSEYTQSIKNFFVNAGEIIIIDQTLKTYTTEVGGRKTMYYGIYPTSFEDILFIKNTISGMEGSDMWEFK